MKNQTKWIVPIIVLTAVALLTVISVRAAPSAPSAPVGTGFTYQGKLEDESGPVSASCDMEFRLYSHATDPSQVGSTIAKTVPISDGLFTVELDFGTSAFDGEGRWLGIQVSCPGDSGFTDLGRQELTAAPYALYALRVGPHDHWGESWAGTGTGLSLSGGTTGVYGTGSSYGVRGHSSSGHGVYGTSGAVNYAGVYGYGPTGVYGGGGTGVYGGGSDYGVHGEGGPSGYGLYGTAPTTGTAGIATDTSGTAYGVYGRSDSTDGYGVYGSGTIGVYGTSDSGHGVEGVGSTGVYGKSNSASGYGVYGFNSSGTGVRGEGSGYGVYGYNDYGGTGVYGFSGFSGYGVSGDSNSGTGVRGYSSSGTAISAEGSGVIESTADSVLYLSPHDMVIRQDNPGLLSVTPQTGGSVRVRNESGTGARYLSIPVSTFGQLFGAQVYVKSLEVCYKVTGSSVGYISATTVSKNNGSGTSANYIYDDTPRNNASYACYTLDASTPRVPIDNSSWVQFNTTFTTSGSSTDITIYTVELTLTEQQN